MKKSLLLVVLLHIFFLTSCKTKKVSTTNKNYTEDNPNTPFIELNNVDKEKVEIAFKTKEISRTQKYAENNYSLSIRENSDIDWQENMHMANTNEPHFWFTCYYSSNDIKVIHVERTCKGYEGFKPAYYGINYKIGNYNFNIYGRNVENYTYILVYKAAELYELDNAYEKNIINDNDVKDIYKHYIDSKFLKFDPYYEPYTTNITTSIE